MGNIKLSQKRTCERCKALYISQYDVKCQLGYFLDIKINPTEPCPKPMTYIELIECKKWYMKNTSC
ncbi:MAG: hypothetical protein JM58_09595 [Peptococcaceae bacterium BICA1-8]|nr:MAG: hypothetical protein JM58_09595 [Peptococcaceae bacterium BICA1-8]